MKVLFSAGELSGDIAGALIASELRRRDPSVRMSGLGGCHMRECGVSLFGETSHLGRVGISESFSAVMPMLRAFHAVRRDVRRDRPDVAVLIANDIFNVLLGRWLRRHAIPTVAVFPPQVWIWGAVSAMFSKSWDAVAASFADEQRIYETHVATTFVGHYLADQLLPATLAERQAARDALAVRGRVIGLLPGSRVHELRALTPLLLDTAARLLDGDSSLMFIVALAKTADEKVVAAELARRGLTAHVHMVHDSAAAMRASDLLLVASGTATLEAALLGTPMIVVYRVQRLTAAVVRTAIALGLMDSDVIALPNLICGEQVVPELTQGRLGAARLAAEARALLDDDVRLSAMRHALARVRTSVSAHQSIRRIAGLIEQVAGVRDAECAALHPIAVKGGSS